MIGVFLDTETNGLNSQIHKILEIALKIVDLATGEVKESFQALLTLSQEEWARSDPSSLNVNGFLWEEVLKGCSLQDVKRQLTDLFTRWQVRNKQAVFICQNPSFDRVFFAQLISVEEQENRHLPYHWLDLASMHWAVAMMQSKMTGSPLPWEIGYSKDMIALYYKLPKEKMPHRAMNGVDHLLLCYQAVVGFPNL